MKTSTATCPVIKTVELRFKKLSKPVSYVNQAKMLLTAMQVLLELHWKYLVSA